MSAEKSKGNNQFDPDDLRKRIRRELIGFCTRRTCGTEKIIRFETEFPGTDLLNLIRVQTAAKKIYFKSRDSLFEIAGVSSVAVERRDYEFDLSDLFTDMRSVLSENHEYLSFYGGIKFDTSSASDILNENFAACEFIIPRFEFYRTDEGNYQFAANLISCDILDNDDLVEEFDKLIFSQDEKPKGCPAVISREDIPDRSSWRAGIKDVLKIFKQGDCDKIVLSRRSDFIFNANPEPFASLMQLRSNESPSYLYCYQYNEHSAFIAMSPEQLYKRDGMKICVDALAGTRKRGSDAGEDTVFAKDLLDSDKDKREHNMVVDGICSETESICTDFVVDKEVRIVKLKTVQHLYHKIQALLKPGFSDEDLLKALHPTPAVGGLPKKIAMDHIREIEAFDRGLYAGPVGYVRSNSAEFSVAIRSGYVTGDMMHLFSGAGIVPGSKPDDEWEEIENKLANFREIIGE